MISMLASTIALWLLSPEVVNFWVWMMLCSIQSTVRVLVTGFTARSAKNKLITTPRNESFCFAISYQSAHSWSYKMKQRNSCRYVLVLAIFVTPVCESYYRKVTCFGKLFHVRLQLQHYVDFLCLAISYSTTGTGDCVFTALTTGSYVDDVQRWAGECHDGSPFGRFRVLLFNYRLRLNGTFFRRSNRRILRRWWLHNDFRYSSVSSFSFRCWELNEPPLSI